MRTFFKTLYGVSAFALFVISPSKVCAITPTELDKQIKEGGELVVVDVRSATLYKKGHIPGAINIPSSLISQKELPQLGKVVVYGEGLGRDSVEDAISFLNKKPGIQAEALDGGFAQWESLSKTTTREKGMKAEELTFITYQDLKKATKENMVLVDLRNIKNSEKMDASGNPTADLSKEFPGVPVTKNPFELPKTRQSLGGSSSGSSPVLVLIDSGGGKAQEMARMLKANGQKRVVILAGGEEILQRQGQSGLQRVGVGTGLRPSNGKP